MTTRRNALVERVRYVGQVSLMSQPHRKDKVMKLSQSQIIALIRRAELAAYRNGK